MKIRTPKTISKGTSLIKKKCFRIEDSNLYQIQYFSITLKKTVQTPSNISLTEKNIRSNILSTLIM